MAQILFYEWKDLDLRRADGRPENGALVELRLTPKRKDFGEPYYDIGHFEEYNGKALWCGVHQSYSASLLKRNYEIRWCYAPKDK